MVIVVVGRIARQGRRRCGAGGVLSSIGRAFREDCRGASSDRRVWRSTNLLALQKHRESHG